MRLQFGGHETFVIREGWLHKGLQLLNDEPEALVGDEAADALGVGQNMAKSIRHWLAATGLAERVGGRRGPLHRTPFGDLVWAHDPYCLAIGTWWAFHTRLAAQPGRAGTWYWFFNHYGTPRFERAACVQGLLHYLQLNRKRLPSRGTLERDLSCLLRCYARAIPLEPADPEDGTECGLSELGLLRYFPGSGVYQRVTDAKAIPPELIGDNVALVWPEARQGQGTVDIRIEDLAWREGGPGRVLQLTSETLFEQLQHAEQTCADLELTGLGAERVLRLPRRDPLAWLWAYYERLEVVDADAA